MSTTSTWVEIDYIGVLKEDPTIRLARSGSIIYALTPCCGASGKGVEYGIACRACYCEVDGLYGATFEEKDVIYTYAEASRLVLIEQSKDGLGGLTEQGLLDHLYEVVDVEDLVEGNNEQAWRVFLGEDESAPLS